MAWIRWARLGAAGFLLGAVGCGAEEPGLIDAGVRPVAPPDAAPTPEAGVAPPLSDAGTPAPPPDAAPPIPVDPGDEADAGCGAVRAEGSFARAPVDVIWAIDSSASMIDEAATIAANLGSFVQGIEGSGANIRVAMLALADPAFGSTLASDPERYRFWLTNVDSHNALAVLDGAYSAGGLLGTEPGYGTFLRPDAATHFIVVSDDESFPMSAGDFQARMEQHLGRPFQFHAIASEALGCGTQPGTQYYALADATGGEKMSICAPDWSSIFARLESAVIATATIPCELPVPAADGRDLENVQVLYRALDAGGDPGMSLPRASGRDACGDAMGWTYDDPAAPARIVLCPAACAQVSAGGDLEIQFGCEPPPILY